MDTLLTTKDIHARTQWSDNTLARYIQQGKFPRPIKVGRMKRWSANAVEEWISKQHNLSNKRAVSRSKSSKFITNVNKANNNDAA